MAKLANNSLFKGISGKCGSVVFRQTKSGTVVANLPRKRSKKPTEAQAEVRDRFSEASGYARNVSKHPEIYMLYEEHVNKKGSSIYKVAMADYLKAPEIREVQANVWHGVAGSEIRVFARDDFRVMAVSLVIKNPDGQVVEHGDAQAEYGDDRVWLYTTATMIQSSAGYTITICASDLAGNKTFKTVNI